MNTWALAKVALVLLSFLFAVLAPYPEMNLDVPPSVSVQNAAARLLLAGGVLVAIFSLLWQIVIAPQLINPLIKGKWAYPTWSASLSIFRGPLPLLHLLGNVLLALGVGLVIQLILQGRQNSIASWASVMLTFSAGLGTVGATHLSSLLFRFRMERS